MPESEQKRKMREQTREPGSKKQKIDEESEDEELPDDETCQICFTKRKTHAFIHAIQPSKYYLRDSNFVNSDLATQSIW